MPSIGSLCVGSINLFIFLSWKILHCSIGSTNNKCRSPQKRRFQALKSLLLPQFLTYRHRTRFIVKRKQVSLQQGLWQNYKLISFFLQILKLSICPPKITYFKKFHEIYYSFFFSKWPSFIHIYVLNALITLNFRYL